MRAMAAGVLATALLLPVQADAKIEIDHPRGQRRRSRPTFAPFLSLTRYADRDDVTNEVMSRLQRRIVAETRQALEPLGFYDPNVNYDVQHEGTLWKVTIHIDPGRPVTSSSEVERPRHRPGANDRAIREVHRSAGHQARPALESRHLRARQGQPGARRQERRLSRCQADPA